MPPHPICFAKQQISTLYIGCVAGRLNEKVWSSKYIDKGMGRSCSAATREPDGTGRSPPFCATRRAVRLDVTTIDLACLRYPAFPCQRRQDARPGVPRRLQPLYNVVEKRILTGSPPNGYRI